MITCKTYTFREDEKRTLSLTLPCFSGIGEDEKNEDKDFYAAARMNRFYGHAANELYEYAKSFFDEDLRRMSFLCHTETEFSDDGIITVTLRLTLHRLHSKEKFPTLRKSLVHRWKDGVLIKNSPR